MVIKMAKKKKKKDSNNNGYSVELTGLILILIGIIGFGFGIVGNLLKQFAMFLAGIWWFIILSILIILGIYMLYKRKMPKFSDQKLIGIYIFIIILLVASHFEFINQTDSAKDIIVETYNNFMERISTMNANNSLHSTGISTVIIGGGFIGALFASALYACVGKTGTIVILVLLGIFASVLTFDINLSLIFKKIFGIFKFKKKDKMDNNNEPDEIPISDSNTIKEAPIEKHEDNKIIITSMEELKNKPITQESLEVPSKTTPTEEDKSYTLPKFSQIFDPLKPKKNNNTSFTQANKEILERVLKDFGIAAKVVEIHIGPAVTEYELTVPPATKVNKIVNIDKEIALALAAKDVIIQAPIP